MAIKLNEIVPWGRSFDEYCRFFSLSDVEFAGRILGCGDGPASFNAEATTQGHDVVSCDPIYAFTTTEIEQRVQACHANMVAQLRNEVDGFVWDYFRNPDDLGECRLAAMRRFLVDFANGQSGGRYVTAALPTLPFKDRQFDLALVSHLLFLYSEQLSLDFHRESVVELLRVANEVRIFPLLGLDRQVSPHLEPICSSLADARFSVGIQTVNYEFQRGGNQMLRIKRTTNG